jgi:hypothetical protein
MPTELAEYFAAERQGGFLLVALALVGLGFAGFLVLTRHAFLAMAWPLVVLGALQLIVGFTVALRTPAQLLTLSEGLRNQPVATATAETQRMRTIDRNFRVFKAVEVAFILVGLLLILLLPHSSAWAAMGMGLLVEASVLLVFDSFAHHRAEVYTKWLQQLA